MINDATDGDGQYVSQLWKLNNTLLARRGVKEIISDLLLARNVQIADPCSQWESTKQLVKREYRLIGKRAADDKHRLRLSLEKRLAQLIRMIEIDPVSVSLAVEETTVKRKLRRLKRSEMEGSLVRNQLRSVNLASELNDISASIESKTAKKLISKACLMRML